MTALLEVCDLQTHFHTTRGVLKAVNGVSLTVDRREILAVVGESGCGKSVTAFSILRLIPEPPGRIAGGQVLFEGTDLTKLTQDEMRRVRGDGIAMIFQEPMTALNPVLTVGEQVAEVLIEHGKATKGQARARVLEILADVRISDPARRIGQYPHELSGGMRQRIGIARALALRPKIIICDEPVSALDVSVRAQVLNLLGDLQAEFGLAYLFISHDLSVVEHVSDRVAVMYLGKIVETAPRDALWATPLHPYTRALLDAAPIPDPSRRRGRRPRLEGEVPSPLDPPSGCRFPTRCPIVVERYAAEAPHLLSAGSGHHVACHRASEGAAASVPLAATPSQTGLRAVN